MKNIKLPIFFVTAYLFIYQLSPYIGFPEAVIIFMFLTLPLLTIWMVIRVLKDGEDSQLEFNEGHLYEDMPKFDKPH